MADHDDCLVQENLRNGASGVLNPVSRKVIVPGILHECLLDGEAVRVANLHGVSRVRESALCVSPAAENHCRDVVVDEIGLHGKLRVAAVDLTCHSELLEGRLLLQVGRADEGLEERPEESALVREGDGEVDAALHHLLGVHHHALREIAEPLQDEHVMEAVERKINHVAELQDLKERLEDGERVAVLVGDVVEPGDVVEGV